MEIKWLGRSVGSEGVVQCWLERSVGSERTSALVHLRQALEADLADGTPLDRCRAVHLTNTLRAPTLLSASTI